MIYIYIYIYLFIYIYYIYILTAIGLSPCGSITVHIYTQNNTNNNMFTYIITLLPYDQSSARSPRLSLRIRLQLFIMRHLH